VEHARWALARRCWLGIGGPVTYKNSRLPEVLREAAVPAGRVLLETDCPWLPPVPHRGQRNEPSYLAHTCDRLAEVLGVGADELTAVTTASVAELFGPWGGELDDAGEADLE
ncbi:hypothetical protein GF314_16540, partial [bacterium]|nr:hypothetical protein [bacterium]